MNLVLRDVITYYNGKHYEKTVRGSQQNERKYYFAGANRIAMRENGVLTWLLSDHLGSTTVTANANGNLLSSLRYTAFGEVRAAGGTTATDYRYTGQREEAELGLYFYNARWCDRRWGVSSARVRSSRIHLPQFLMMVCIRQFKSDQLQFEQADDPRLLDFIQRYEQTRRIQNRARYVPAAWVNQVRRLAWLTDNYVFSKLRPAPEPLHWTVPFAMGYDLILIAILCYYTVKLLEV